MAEAVIIKPVLDVEKCILCEICVSFCPSSCITVSDNDDLWFDYRCCRGCNTCATVCPEEAIEMVMVIEEGRS